MYISPLKKLFYISFVALLLSSCGGTKQLSKPDIYSSSELSNHQIDFVLDNLHANETQFDYISAKGNATVQADGKTYHLKAVFRMQDDQKIWLSLSAAFGIEVARLLLTTDSVFFINRLERTYFNGGYDFISKILNTNIDFDMAQSLLTGRDVKWYDNNSLKVRVNNKHYQLESMHRRRLKRYAKKNELLTPVFYQNVRVEPKHFKITRIKMKAHKDDETKNIIIDYDDFKEVEGQLIPFAYTLDILSQQPVFVKINWKRIEFEDSHLTFPFKVPASYKPMKP